LIDVESKHASVFPQNAVYLWIIPHHYNKRSVSIRDVTARKSYQLLPFAICSLSSSYILDIYLFHLNFGVRSDEPRTKYIHDKHWKQLEHLYSSLTICSAPTSIF